MMSVQMKRKFQISAFLFLCILFIPMSARTQEEKKTTVIFVCEHGGARSTIASLYFNKMALDNHLPYQAIFRGLTPDPIITQETEKGKRYYSKYFTDQLRLHTIIIVSNLSCLGRDSCHQ